MTTDTWRQRYELTLMVSAALFLGAYAWRVLDTDLADQWRLICDIVLWVTWTLFAVDYFARLAMAESRGRFFVRHLHDLAIVALPALRPLRLLRIVALLGVMNQLAGRSLRGRVTVYVTGYTALIVFLAALAVLDAERANPDSLITSFGDALWWAVVSTTTVGYGDLYPVTTTGRFIAVGLMITGIALLGTVTASIASWLVENVQDEHAADKTESQIERLADELHHLREALAKQQQLSP